MKQLIIALICVFSIGFFEVVAQKPLVQYDLEGLKGLRNQLAQKKAIPEVQKEYVRFLKKADKILLLDNPTVIDKEIETPSKSKNDYLSISRYWWPDKSKRGGLPWVRRDGDTNPDTQTDAVDRKRLSKMINYVETLSLAYFFSGKEKYATKGIEVIKTWFINKKTKMNPHLQYAQSVPGNPKSRRSGILDGRGIPLRALDGITLISSSKQWTENDQLGINKWLIEYTIWLVYSQTGIAGSEQVNNHGSWYSAQMAALGYYTGDMTIVKNAVDKTKMRLINQLDVIGAQEHELKRTRSYFYSCFNLDAITRVAIIAEKAGIPFWNYSSEGKGLSKALSFLLPAANGAEWEYKTTSKGLELAYLAPVLRRVSGRISNPEFEETYQYVFNKFLKKQNKTSQEKKIYKDFYFINQGLY